MIGRDLLGEHQAQAHTLRFACHEWLAQGLRDSREAAPVRYRRRRRRSDRYAVRASSLTVPPGPAASIALSARLRTATRRLDLSASTSTDSPRPPRSRLKRDPRMLARRVDQTSHFLQKLTQIADFGGLPLEPADR